MDKAMHSEFEGHTPGPWKAETVHGTWGNLVYCRIVSDNFEHPGGMAYASIPLKGKTKKQKELAGLYASQGEQLAQRNALLIAAAPDLLKENQSLRSELQKQKELDRVNLNLTFQLVIQNELNGQLIKHLEIMATRLANMIDEKEGCPIEDDEVSEAFALIKKSKES